MTTKEPNTSDFPYYCMKLFTTIDFNKHKLFSGFIVVYHIHLKISKMPKDNVTFKV